MSVRYGRVCIIGVGLIGGSLARALKAAQACDEIVGVGRDADHLRRAVELGVVDRIETDMAKGLEGAELAVVAVPVGRMGEVFRQMAPHLQARTIVTDVGSTKASVVKAALEVFGAVPPRFVPGHPIAGTERSGVEASFAELYRDRRVILTPLPETESDAVEAVKAMWEAAGALVETMDVVHHDEVLAATSHLPHVLAFSLVHALARMDEKVEIFKYAAGGFRDFTRIASSDATMWHDICLANREAILKTLAYFTSDLAALADAIEQGDGEYIRQVFARAKEARDNFCNL